MWYKKKRFLLMLVSVICIFSLNIQVISSNISEEDIDKGLIAHYTLDGNLEDSSGDFAKGRLIGSRLNIEDSGEIIYREAMRGQGAYFHGKSGVLLDDGLINSHSYSVALWLKPESITAFTTSFFAAKDREQWLSISPEGPSGDTELWSRDDWYDASADIRIPTNMWSHITFTVDNGEVKFYINGVERFSGEEFPDIFTSDQGTFALAVNWSETPYRGMMDDLRIYNKAISEDLVEYLAQGVEPLVDGPDFMNVGVHDPMVIKDDGTFYVFGSHLASAKSDDLIQWEQISTHLHNNNHLIPNVFEEMREALEWGESDTFWAGNVIQLADGRYYFYYSVCRGDSPRSALGLAVSDNVDGPYENVEILLKSGMWGQPSEDGRVYDANIHPNAIDPHTFYDEEGKLWMVYGSYSGGIFILEIDSATGYPLPGQGYGKKLLGGNHSRIEAPYILYSPDSGYYYLFLSFGGLGADGGYNIRIARSENPDGPYYDPMGNDMINVRGPMGSSFDDLAIEQYGGKLIGNFRFLNLDSSYTGVGYVSPGHNSAYYDKEEDKYYIFFHSRFPGQGERHQVRVHQMFINENGWPIIVPHRYAGEEIGSYAEEDIIGTYAFVNHGREISSEIKDSILIDLKSDGTISGNQSGKWVLDGDHNITLTINGTVYNGVVIEQWDNGLKKYMLAFTAFSEDKGTAIWGSQI